MNEHQVKGKVKEAAGEAQEQLGKATGNRDQQAKGHAKEQEGKVQKKAGDVKQGIDKIVRKP
ncbi:MAG: hypothetical protein AVDCRST_MAG51-3170 [uncultured Ramlibacter sp.]|uniref:CsbD-like domain-containing protein n=1 Tax=uncultured Ramlibacter sp. TaxID=260755 RepID=A0A6J4QEC9_9BURK|nr:MAG: hypothetical protein AVDCRST_MAG51-3170 [uncultured Ramlibacter sp.]